jgi:hypothetical protein
MDNYLAAGELEATRSSVATAASAWRQVVGRQYDDALNGPEDDGQQAV